MFSCFFWFFSSPQAEKMLFFASSSLFCMFLKRFPQLLEGFFSDSQKISHSSDFFSSEYMKFSKNFTYIREKNYTAPCPCKTLVLPDPVDPVKAVELDLVGPTVSPSPFTPNGVLNRSCRSPDHSFSGKRPKRGRAD